MNTFARKCPGIFQDVVKNHNVNVSSLCRRFVAYKSAVSLQNLHPNSSLKITSPSPPEKCDFFIPIDQLEVTYSKSSGPGGQNVNKVNTKVDVRFHLATAKWLSAEVKQGLSEKLQEKVTKDGYLIFKSDLTRSQQLNLADCLEKIRASIRNCLVKKVELSPETEEKIRRNMERSARERLILKRHRSQTKAERQMDFTT